MSNEKVICNLIVKEFAVDIRYLDLLPFKHSLSRTVFHFPRFDISLYMEKPSFISNAFYLERSLFINFDHEKDFFRANSTTYNR